MNTTGVLLIHGFAGSKDEIEKLYYYLKDHYYYVEIPTLAGHERTKKDLAKTSYHDWILSAAHAYAKLISKCDKIVVIGFSMGGLIAVNLFMLRPFDKLITVNTPIYYWNVKQICRNLLSDFKIYSKLYYNSSIDKAFSSLAEFLKILNRTKPLFETITCPTLIIQTLDDDIVYPNSANFIYNNVNGRKKLVWVPEGGHFILKTKYTRKIGSEILKFINYEVN